MKKLNFLLVVLIIACLAAFYGYRTLDSLQADSDAPEIYMDETIPELSVKDPKTALLQGITASDKRDGDVTASLVVESMELLDSDGRLMVSYAAFDKAGNVAKAQREALYTDYESPKFTLNGPLLYRDDTNFDVLRTVGAIDMIDGDIQHRVRATSLVENSIADRGTHDVRFQVTNSLGDTTSIVFPVEVYDSKAYEASVTLKKYLVYLEKGGSFTPGVYLADYYLRGESIDLRGTLPYGYSLKTKGTVNTQVPGVYPVEYRVTYTIKNEINPDLDQEYTAYTKLIVVVEG